MALFRYDATNNKLVPLTSEGSGGIQVGAVMAFAKGTTSPNWLLADGRDTTGTAEELRTHYPALYTYLGNSNVLPDYRECTLVGVGQNDTDTIAAHDVYTLGQFKDDQFQQWTATFDNVNNVPSCTGIASYKQNGSEEPSQTNQSGGKITLDPSTVARTGTTTHGKQKGVAFYIKATSAGIEVDKDLYATKGYVNDAISYSTEETLTGGKWIDGKPIYRKVTPYNGTIESSTLNSSIIIKAVVGQPNIDTLISVSYVGRRNTSTGEKMSATFDTWIQSDTTIKVLATSKMYVENIISMYTKATD